MELKDLWNILVPPVENIETIKLDLSEGKVRNHPTKYDLT